MTQNWVSTYVDGFVINLEVLQAVHSLVCSVGLLEGDLDLAEGGAGGRRAVHQLNLTDGADAPLLVVLV